jgi:hypothetical protein
MPLKKITTSLAAAEERLETLYSQVENAKTELTKPFPQEAELAEKSARLTELDSLLSLDGRDEPDGEAHEVDTPVADDVGIDGDTPEKALGAKADNDTLSGDETTPQTPPVVSERNPQPIPQSQTPPLTQAPVRDIPAVATVETEIKGDGSSPTEPPQTKPKKKSYDER